MVHFSARLYDYRNWIGTLQHCDNPQVDVQGFVVRIYFVEVVGTAVTAYGLVVNDKSSDRVKAEMKRVKKRPDYQTMIRSNIRGFNG